MAARRALGRVLLLAPDAQPAVPCRLRRGREPSTLPAGMVAGGVAPGAAVRDGLCARRHPPEPERPQASARGDLDRRLVRASAGIAQASGTAARPADLYQPGPQ